MQQLQEFLDSNSLVSDTLIGGFCSLDNNKPILNNNDTANVSFMLLFIFLHRDSIPIFCQTCRKGKTQAILG